MSNIDVSKIKAGDTVTVVSPIAFAPKWELTGVVWEAGRIALRHVTPENNPDNAYDADLCDSCAMVHEGQGATVE